MSHDAIDSSKEYTYEEIADILQTTVDALYMLSSRKISPLIPTRKSGREVLFSGETVKKFIEWWERNEIFRSSAPPDNEQSFDEREALVYLGDESGPMPATTRLYYRRRYGKLYPDFYQKSDTRGRPRAMYTQSSLDAFKKWLAAGKPEMKVKSITTIDGKLDYMVVFSDGVTLGIKGQNASITPDVGDDAKAAYLAAFKERMWRKMINKDRKSSKKK